MLISSTSSVGRFALSSSAASEYKAPSSSVKSLPSASLPPLKIGSQESTTNLRFGRFLRKPKTRSALDRCPSRGHAEILNIDEVACATSDLPILTTQISTPVRIWYRQCSLSPRVLELSSLGLSLVSEGLAYILRVPNMLSIRVSTSFMYFLLPTHRRPFLSFL